MASGLNKVFLLGNLGNDPELRQHDSGASMRFRLATTESWRDKQSGELRDRTEWHNVTMWGKRAEALAAILTKGERIMVEGRIETRSYEADGATKYFTEIKAQDIYLSGRGGRRWNEDSQVEVTLS